MFSTDNNKNTPGVMKISPRVFEITPEVLRITPRVLPNACSYRSHTHLIHISYTSHTALYACSIPSLYSLYTLSILLDIEKGCPRECSYPARHLFPFIPFMQHIPGLLTFALVAGKSLHVVEVLDAGEHATG